MDPSQASLPSDRPMGVLVRSTFVQGTELL